MAALRPLLIGLAVAGVGLLIAASASGASSDAPRVPSGGGGPGGPSPLPAEREAMRQHLRQLAQKLEWPGLDDFLTVVAYTESRYNPNAINPEGGPNAARGLFGMRPQSGLVAPLSPSRPNDLLDPRIAVAAAADYAWRLRAYRGDNVAVGQLDWGDIRRGWALPTLVDDYKWSKPRSQDVLDRLRAAERATGLDVETRLAFPNGYQWPGLAWALQRLEGAAEAPQPTFRWVGYGGLETLEVVVGGARMNDDVPIVVALHGRGGEAVGLANLLSGFTSPLRLLLPNAPTAFGNSKTARAWWQPSTKNTSPEQMAELMQPAAQALAPMLMDAISRLARRPAVFGHSQGGMLTYLMAAKHPNLLDLAVPVSGWLPEQLWPTRGPMYPRIRAIHGADDETIPVGLDQTTASAFQQSGADVELTVVPKAGHGLTKLWPLALAELQPQRRAA